MTSWNTGYAESGGERIYWERAGEGVPIVLCHGAGSNHLSFYHQVPGLSAAGHQVIVWDQRGFGNSTLLTGEIGIAVAGRDLSAVLDANGQVVYSQRNAEFQAMRRMDSASVTAFLLQWKG